MHEEEYADDGVNEHDEEEKETYVEESWEGEDEREEKGSKALGRPHESQNPGDAKNSEGAKKARGECGRLFNVDLSTDLCKETDERCSLN